MGTNELILRQAQSALEVVRGTDLAATRKVYAQIAEQYERALSAFVDTTGTFEARRRPVYAREKPRFTATDLCTFEDLAWWMQLAVKGGVSGVTDSGVPTPAFTYAFTPSNAADDIKSMVLEFNESGNPYQCTQVMVDQWTLRGDSDNDGEPGWMFEANMPGLAWSTTTFTGSLADRTTEVIPARGTKLFIDDASGSIGATQKSGKLVSWSLTGVNNIHYKAFAEDESTFAANKVGRGARTFDAQFTFEFDDDVEFAKYRNAQPQQRKIRLEREGTIIHTTVKKRLRVDMAGYWSSWARGDREGNLTATFNLMAFFDTALSKSFSVELVNALSALP